eukprot:TRINITY_DN23515_c0_g1_i2.p1 TRINITY_DN23515_c0_g1~~TRINITY_DN23515_c0_g1_i2.p1  ORF type:complete len:596 (-),score=132.41 TRINITY_DN23515_c0_g1_i2:201-1988(-)
MAYPPQPPPPPPPGPALESGVLCVALGSSLRSCVLHRSSEAAADGRPPQPTALGVILPSTEAAAAAGDLGQAAALPTAVTLTFRSGLQRTLPQWFVKNGLQKAGSLPEGVLIGDHNLVEDGTKGVAKSVARLLGLRPTDSKALLALEAQCAGVAGLDCEASFQEEEDGEEQSSAEPALKVWVSEAAEGKKCVQEQLAVTAEALMTLIITYLRETAGAVSGKELSEVALTVPSWWSAIRRAALQRACRAAHMSVWRMVSKPLCLGVGLLLRMARVLPDVSRCCELHPVESPDGAISRILAVCVDDDGVDAALLEACEVEGEDSSTEVPEGAASWREALRRSPPLSGAWMYAASKTTWRVGGMGGGPRYESGGSRCSRTRSPKNQSPNGRSGGTPTWMMSRDTSDGMRELKMATQCAIRNALIGCLGAAARKTPHVAPAAALVVDTSGCGPSLLDELDCVLSALREEVTAPMPCLRAEASDLLAGLAEVVVTDASAGCRKHADVLGGALRMVKHGVAATDGTEASPVSELLFKSGQALPSSLDISIGPGEAPVSIEQQDFDNSWKLVVELMPDCAASRESRWCVHVDSSGMLIVHQL